ncbi:MAG: GNAT family N-acetyltransferase [Ruminiclostridium sp.]|nr:GNAT family N-acetyltransferase [Ruminiclostridium sp.]
MDLKIVVSKTADLKNDAFIIRKTVFTDEQGFFDELDSIDDIAYHVVAYDCGRPIGCGRMFPEREGVYHIGRIAVLSEYRNCGIGSSIMNALEKTAASDDAELVVLSAQRRARDFYLKIGYETVGDEYLEEGYPHTLMQKKI